jgi:hypothetical protein
MKQKDVVFNAFHACLTALNITGVKFVSEVPAEQKDEVKNGVIDLVTQSIMSGEMDLDKPELKADEKAAKGYAKALWGNWIKKDDRLNGGVKYVPQTRRGPIVKDENLKKLKGAIQSLQLNKADPALIAKTQEVFDARKAELAAAKAASGAVPLDEAMAILVEAGIVPAAE